MRTGHQLPADAGETAARIARETRILVIVKICNL